MRRHPKASTAGSTQRRAGRLGHIFRGAFATRGASSDAKGSGAPAARRLVLPVGVFAALLALMIFAIPAGATKTHLFKEVFGSAAQPSFGFPQGVAVDQSSGDLLVMDAEGASSIKRYNPDGTPANFSGLGTNVIDGQGNGECATVPADCDQTPENGLGFASPGESQIAVDNSGTATDGNIYVTQSSPNVVNIFSAEGKYLGQLTAAGVNGFTEACGVAVDPSGAVYVGDFTSGIHKFVPAANPPVNADNTATFSSVSTPCTLAAGAGATAGFIFPATYNGEVSKVDSGSGELKYVVSPDSTTTVSVDPATGHVYVATGDAIKELDASGAGSATSLASFGSNFVRGVAVRESTSNVYVTRAGSNKAEVFGPLVTLPDATTGSASAIDKTTATLNGAVNPDGVALSECKFEYGTTASYGQTIPCAESTGAIGTGTSPVSVHADISGLTLGAGYHFRLLATNANGTVNGADQSFETLSTPVIVEWAESVIRTEATLKGEINPKGFATTYKFEWGTTASYGNAGAVGNAGSDSTSHIVTKALTGLTPDTLYHYRIVATNSIGTREGPDQTFTTYAPVSLDTGCSNQSFRSGPGAQLPDCRAYEMVSPVDKNNGDIAWFDTSPDNTAAALNQSSLDGGKIAYSSYKSFGDAVSTPYTSQYIATRGVDGWSSHGISPPSRGGSVLTVGHVDLEYKAFSPDLSTGWLVPESGLSLAPGAQAGHLNIYKRDNVTESYQVLSKGPRASGVNFGDRMQFQGASKDGSHAIFAINESLVPGAPYFDVIFPELYEWVNGELRLVSILPNGEPVDGGPTTAGSVPGLGLDIKGRVGAVSHAISDDGSRIFWTWTNESSVGPLFVRIDGEETVPVSGSVTTESAQFWTASADGSTAIFTVTKGPFEGNLYEFDVDTETPTLIAHEVFGVTGASEDASYLYFVSLEDLDAGATAGGRNLYLYHEGTISFIATFSPSETVEPSPSSRYPIYRDARVTPDGRHLVFLSARSLTGYDSTDSDLGEAVSEVYRYDAENGALNCVSCNPSGARPSPSGRFPGGPFFDYALKVAAWIPTWQNQLYQSRLVSDDGSRVFFNSFDGLVPQDTNGKQDVYQWEAPGTGGCEEGDPDFSELNDGCVNLISSGESPEESEFIDADPSGQNLFLRTKSKLVPQDPGLIDLYDARVGGGFAPPGSPLPCVGDACQTPPEAPNDATPASANFRGAGNPTPRKARNRKCRARSRHSAKGKRQAKSKQTKRCRRNNRRAGR